MENFLLLFDELDDLISMVGALWRPVVGFLTAVTLFVATGLVFYNMPMVAEALALVFVTLGVVETFRERRGDTPLGTTRSSESDVEVPTNA